MKTTDLLSDPVQLPENGRCLGKKGVFKIKRDLDGHLEHFFARLVAQGFSQFFGGTTLVRMHLWHNFVLTVLCMR